MPKSIENRSRKEPKMAIKSYSTSDYIKTKTGEIDGTVYTIRRMGAGDELDIAAISSKVLRLQEQLKLMQDDIKRAKSEEETLKVVAENSEAMEKLAEGQAKLEKVYASLFDDGGDQSKSRALVHKLGYEGVKKLLDDIFGEDDG